ncbi:MAG: hypothetical protein K9J13_17555 [Saprospiraceae bacterium]|nr:hypothetical protein [Saprospiraceae bacterium]
MYSFITPKPQLEQEALAIGVFLNKALEKTSDDVSLSGDDIVEIGNQIAVYLARTGTMQADAKYHLNEKLKSDILVSLIEQMKGTYLSASAQKEFIRSACTYETWLVDMIERENRTCTHLLDWCRSVLSKYKEELNYSRGVSGSYNQ